MKSFGRFASLGLLSFLITPASIVLPPKPIAASPTACISEGWNLQLKALSAASRHSPRTWERAKMVLEKRLKAANIQPTTVTINAPRRELILTVPKYTTISQINRLLIPGKLEILRQKPGTSNQLYSAMNERRGLLSVLQELQETPNSRNTIKQLALLKRNQQVIKGFFRSTPLTQAYITDVQADEKLALELQFQFNSVGERILTNLTQEMAGQEMSLGFFVDNELFSHATVPEQYRTTGIRGGKLVLVKAFVDSLTTQDVAIALRSGNLPVPLAVKEQKPFKNPNCRV